VEVSAIPNDMFGKRLLVTPHGVFKQSVWYRWYWNEE
jgi:hypothetical protein